MTYPATNTNDASKLLIGVSNQVHEVVNGTSEETVTTDSGEIPTLRKSLVDNFYFTQTNLPWDQGVSEVVFNQLREFNGEYYYAPLATTGSPIPMGVTPVGDPNWKNYSTPLTDLVTDAFNSKVEAENSVTTAEALLSGNGYQGLWPDTGGIADKGDTYQTQVGGTPTGNYFTALQNTSVDPVGDNVNWKINVGASELNQAQEELLPLGSQIYPRSGYLADGMSVTAGTTHLRVLISGEPDVVAMTPLAIGAVSSLSETGATIGVTSVTFSTGFELNKLGATQSDIESKLNNPRHKRCELTALQTVDILGLDIPNRSELIGFGEDTVLRLSGEGTAINVKTSNPAVNALSNVTLKDFNLNMNFLSNSIGIDMVYASVQSMLDGIKISNVGPNSVGARLSKEWYARTQRCSIRSTKANGVGAVGVLIDTSEGQINDIPVDFQINSIETGCIVDTTSNYVYKLVIPDTFHAEGCDTGLYVKSGYGVRQAIISGYFENNAVADIVWGDPVAGANDITQTIIYNSTAFNPTGSKVVLYEGNHIFIGVDRLDTLEINRAARVMFIGCEPNTVINNTGDPRRIVRNATVNDFASESVYSNLKARPSKSTYYTETTANNSVIFDIVSDTFGAAPANGMVSECVAVSRRTYESGTNKVRFTIGKNAAANGGLWSLSVENTFGGALSASIDSTTGEITLSDARGDTKVYNLMITPY